MRINKNLTLLLCILSIGIYAQKNEFKLYYGISEMELSAKKNGVEVQVDGSGNITLKNLKEIGLNYGRKLSEHISIETGIKFLSADFEVSSSVYQSTGSRFEKFEMTTIPILANYTFWKYLYINGGIQVDFQTSNNSLESQSGIGYLVGFGAKYEFKDFSIFINPNYQRHTAIAFEENSDKRKLHGKALHFGVGYKF